MVAAPSYPLPVTLVNLSVVDRDNYFNLFIWQREVDQLRYLPNLDRPKTYAAIRHEYNAVFPGQGVNNRASISTRYSQTKRRMRELVEKNEKLGVANIMLEFAAAARVNA